KSLFSRSFSHMKAYFALFCTLLPAILLAACSGPELDQNDAGAVAADDTRAQPAVAQPETTSASSADTTEATATDTADAEPPARNINPKGRVIVLGFDGVDPDLAAEMMAAGELPNLAQLRDQGTFTALESSL